MTANYHIAYTAQDIDSTRKEEAILVEGLLLLTKPAFRKYILSVKLKANAM